MPFGCRWADQPAVGALAGFEVFTELTFPDVMFSLPGETELGSAEEQPDEGEPGQVGSRIPIGPAAAAAGFFCITVVLLTCHASENLSRKRHEPVGALNGHLPLNR